MVKGLCHQSVKDKTQISLSFRLLLWVIFLSGWENRILILYQKIYFQFSRFIIYFFCLTGAVSNASTLFTYDSEYLLDTYYYGSKHDASFVPVFSVPDSPDDPLANEASEICSGEGSQFCRYDKTTLAHPNNEFK